MPLKRLKKYVSFYHIAHAERVKLYNLKWRIFFILLVAVAMILVSEYLQNRYPYTIYDALKSTTFPLHERLFSWFAMGVVFGVVALAFLYEGEFLLSLHRLMHAIEEETRLLTTRAAKKPVRTKRR